MSSIFDGLISKVEGAVTSAEARLAGLDNSASSKVASLTTPWIGPLQPGIARPAPRSLVSLLTASPAGPKAASLIPGFNMVEDMLGGASKDVTSGLDSLSNFFGFPTASKPAQVAPADAAGWAQDLSRWSNILDSLDRSMNAKDGAADLSAAVRSWKMGAYQDAQTKLSALVTGSGDTKSTLAAHDYAVSQATGLQKAIQDRWNQAAQSGTPSVADYVTAPFSAASQAVSTTYETGASAVNAVGRAVKSAGAALPAALDSTQNILKYGAIAAAALAGIYLLSFAPRPRNN